MIASALTLDQACTAIVDCEHKTSVIDPGGSYFAVGTPAMRDNRINYNEARRISYETFLAWTKRLRPRENDVLLAREAPVGPVVRIPSTLNVAPGQRTVLLRPNPEIIDPGYFYYLLASSEQQRRLLQLAEGSTVAHLNVADVRSFELPLLPALSQQRAISRTLETIDEKYESNRRAQTVAQDLLRTMYRERFVDRDAGLIQAGWKQGTMRDVLSLVRKSTKAGQEPSRPYVPIDTLPMHSLGLEGSRPNSEAQSSLQLFDENDILIGAMRVYFHRVCIAPFDGVTRNTTFVLRPKIPNALEYALLLCDHPATIEYARATSKGSTMPYAVWDGGLAEFPVVIPPNNELVEFAAQTRALVMMIRDRFTEQIDLLALRDSLLESFMSGQARVASSEGA